MVTKRFVGILGDLQIDDTVVCEVCKKETKEFKHIESYDSQDGHEDVLVHDCTYCRNCFIEAWDSKHLGYSSKETAAKHFDKYRYKEKR